VISPNDTQQDQTDSDYRMPPCTCPPLLGPFVLSLSRVPEGLSPEALYFPFCGLGLVKTAAHRSGEFGLDKERQCIPRRTGNKLIHTTSWSRAWPKSSQKLVTSSRAAQCSFKFCNISQHCCQHPTIDGA